MQSIIGRNNATPMVNKTGGTRVQGEIVVIEGSADAGFEMVGISGFSSGIVGVVFDLFIDDEELGLVVTAGYVPKIKLGLAAAYKDMIKCSSTPGEGTPHAAPLQVGDFAQVLSEGMAPEAILFGLPNTLEGEGTYFAPSGLTGATSASRYVGSTASGAPGSGTFNTGDWVIDQTGVIWVCTAGGTPGTWQTPPAVPNGYQPYAYPLNFVANMAFTTALALGANGGSIAVPISLVAPMQLESVSIRNTDTTTARIWGWDLYVQTGLTETLDRVAACTADESYTASSASIRTLAVGSAPVALGAGLYWLVIQNRHATNTYGLGTTAVSSAFGVNGGQTKTTANPNGATLDFIAATWAKQTNAAAVRLNGRVFGEATAF